MGRYRMMVVAFCLVAVATHTIWSSGSTEKAAAGAPQIQMGYPIVKEPVTISVGLSQHSLLKDPAEMAIVKELEKLTNVHIDWKLIPASSFAEKKNLMFASGDYPDAFIGGGLTRLDHVEYGEQGVLVPLEQLIAKYAPNVNKILAENPVYRSKITTPSGHIYALPRSEEYIFFYVPDKTAINKTWLDKLGLAVPTTPDALYEVLKAFRDRDPNGNGKKDDLPFSFLFRDASAGIASFVGAFGMVDPAPRHLAIQDKKVVFTATHPSMIDAYKYLHKLYVEGLIDPEVFTQKGQQYTAKLQAEVPIVGMFVTWATTVTAGRVNEKSYEYLLPLRDQQGKQRWIRGELGIYADGLVVTKRNTQQEVSVRWADTIYDEDHKWSWHLGRLGEVIKKEADGTYSFVPLPPQFKSQPEFRYSTTPAVGYVLTAKDLERLHLNYNQTVTLAGAMTFMPFATVDVYPDLYLTKAQNDVVTTLSVDIESYVDKTQAKWITDGGVEREWESFLAQLKRMRLDEYLKALQDAYSSYLSH